MAKKNVAVVTSTISGLSFEDTNHSGDIQLIPTDIKNKARDKLGNLSIIVNSTTVVVITNGSDGAGITGASGSGTFISTSTSTKTGGVFIIREEDESIEITMTKPGSPPQTYTTKVIVDDAFCDKVKSE